ncbi:cytochrome c oxidase subunit va domain-containing protein [Ditylenchus destructor]|uniref:Cytochrome c oxidase subunit 5A, mitochondrial n=1 Tax=Ditylenchus destructor TaxID=166010 RepID=A0AAD4NIW5_9BILA|nr:cytochrome c oxidase subunit va domain-containing protein [Ditylenchus destructor]
MASMSLRLVTNGARSLSCASARQISTTPLAAKYTWVAARKINQWPAEKFDKHFIEQFSQPDIDGWEVRKVMTDLHEQDCIPDPAIVAAGLRACRRINDIGLALRFLEAIKMKCGSNKNRKLVYPWIIQEVRPVLDELGISTPEELGMDQPEFFIPNPDWWWEKRWYKDFGLDKMPGYKHFA